MDKKETIEKIIEAQRRLTQDLVPQAMESWRKLDVPLAQLKSLFIITNRNDTNFRGLAKDLDVTPGNVTGIVDRLVEQGLVTRNPSPDDRRIIRLQATDKGRALLADLMETQTRNLTRAMERMSMEDLNSLLRGLSGFIKAIEGQKEK